MLPPPIPRAAAPGISTQRPSPASHLKRAESSSQAQRQIGGQDASLPTLKRSMYTRTPVTTTALPSALQRTTSIRREPLHARSRSSVQDAPTSGLGRPVAKHVRTQSAAKVETKQADLVTAAPSSLRPNFTTHQQHYSPAKSSVPKPPIPASRIAAPALASTTLDTFETQKLQSELLYLSLLHQYSTPTLSQYTASAKRTLRRRFDTLTQSNLAIIDEERRMQQTANIAALAAWSLPSANAQPETLQDFVENIQRLSRCLSDVSTWTEAGGRYDKLVHEFETWIDESEAILAAREESEGSTSGDRELFISPLSASWHQYHASMEQRLRILEREVAALPPAPDRENAEGEVVPTLEVMLGQLADSVRGMKEELSIMVVIEKDVLGREKEWVDSTVDRILSSTHETQGDERGEENVPLWHRIGREVAI